MGVEIKQETLNQDHPKNIKEIQKLGFTTNSEIEMSRLTILNPDSGTYRL